MHISIKALAVLAVVLIIVVMIVLHIHDQETLKKMAVVARDSALRGGMMGLITDGFHGGLTSAVTWTMVGAITSGISHVLDHL
jgi:nitric oxide reductase large subunit